MICNHYWRREARLGNKNGFCASLQINYTTVWLKVMISSRLLSVTPESYPVAIYGSDWIVAKRKRSCLSGARGELWDSLTLPITPSAARKLKHANNSQRLRVSEHINQREKSKEDPIKLLLERNLARGKLLNQCLVSTLQDYRKIRLSF